MAKASFKELRRVTRGAVFVVCNPKTERAAAWYGGACISFYDLGGALIDTVSAPLWGGPCVIRRKALEILGKGAGDV